MVEVIGQYIPIITIVLSIAALYNGIKTRQQGKKIQKQDLALRQIEREDKFRYLPPHMYVRLKGEFKLSDSLKKARCSIIISNQDERDVLIEKVEWAYSIDRSWSIDKLNVEPFIQKTADKVQFDIDPDDDIFKFSTRKPFAMIDNIIGLSIRVKLSTDDGMLYPIGDIRFKRYLIYRNIKSPVIRKIGVCALCKYYGISMIHAFI